MQASSDLVGPALTRGLDAEAVIVADLICLMVPANTISDGGDVQIPSVSVCSRRFVTRWQIRPLGPRDLRVTGRITLQKHSIARQNFLFDGPSVALHGGCDRRQ